MQTKKNIKLIDLLKINNNYEPIEGPGAQGLGTDKEIRHNYVSSYYEEAFSKFQNLKINILEVGLACGASLKLWFDFFSDAQIYGVDITTNYINPYVLNENFKIFFEDAYTQEFINKIPNMDIIIDDGPHTFDSQIQFLKLFSNKVNPGGLLIIEDIADIQYVETFKTLIGNKNYKVIDTREKYQVPDNILFAVEF